MYQVCAFCMPLRTLLILNKNIDPQLAGLAVEGEKYKILSIQSGNGNDKKLAKSTTSKKTKIKQTKEDMDSC